jgi:hypothetical protein
LEALDVTTNDAQAPAPQALGPVVAPQGSKTKAARADTPEDDPHKSANFDLVVMHYYASRSADADAPVQAVYRAMLASWEAREGNITSSYFCNNIAAAAVTTDRDRLFSAGNPYRTKADLPLYRLITRADHLARFVQDNLVGLQRRASIDEIYAIQTIALACMDDLAGKPAQKAEAAHELRVVTCAKIEADLAHAEQYAYSVWQRRAQMAYLEGMGFGVLGVAAVLLAVTLLLPLLLSRYPEIPPRIYYVPWVLLLGAIGAVLSVMQRLTSGNLRLRIDSSLSENRTLGIFRPIIGSAFALALLILVLGGLIPLEVPSGSTPEEVEKRAFFLVGIAFLAGFSERFAQDMIGVGKSTGMPAAQSAQTETPNEGSPAN